MIRVRKVDAQRVQEALKERIARVLAGSRGNAGDSGNAARLGEQVLVIPRVFASAQEEASFLEQRCPGDARHLVVVLWGTASKEVLHG